MTSTTSQTNLNPFSTQTSSFFSPPQKNPTNGRTFQDKLRDFLHTHPVVSFIVIIAFIVSIFTLVILLVEANTPKSEEPETAPATYFENRYLLNYSIGNSNSNQTYTNLNSVILDQDSIASAPHENTFYDKNTFACVLVESSYKKLPNPAYTYHMNLDVSDGRTYTLTIRLSPDDYGYSYMVTIADRTDSDTAADYVFINTDNFDQYSSELNAWIDSFNLNSPIVTVSPNTAEDID